MFIKAAYRVFIDIESDFFWKALLVLGLKRGAVGCKSAKIF
jgi:hypothetical protein